MLRRTNALRMSRSEPDHPPRRVDAVALSSTSINVTWLEPAVLAGETEYVVRFVHQESTEVRQLHLHKQREESVCRLVHTLFYFAPTSKIRKTREDLLSLQKRRSHSVFHASSRELEEMWKVASGKLRPVVLVTALYELQLC